MRAMESASIHATILVKEVVRTHVLHVRVHVQQYVLITVLAHVLEDAGVLVLDVKVLVRIIVLLGVLDVLVDALEDAEDLAVVDHAITTALDAEEHVNMAVQADAKDHVLVDVLDVAENVSQNVR